MIDLRSDTVTKPTPEMKEAMFNAPVGDDVFEEDPTINALEEKAADLFGMEKALFCPSGTMTNQIAMKVHLNSGDEVICSSESHIYRYEGGGIAANAGASVRLIEGWNGIISADQVKAEINVDNVHFPATKLVSLENTSNRGGGCCYDMDDIIQIQKVCEANDLKFHLDGARLYNAIVAKNEDPKQYGSLFNTISLCLSKGLGAPVGSVLVGSEREIYKARRIRKVFGGGMRQAGYLAGAAIYALDNHIDKIKEDHEHAKMIGEAALSNKYVKEVLPVETNIIVMVLNNEIDNPAFLAKLHEAGIIGVDFGHQRVRLVTHLDISRNEVGIVEDVLKTMS